MARKKGRKLSAAHRAAISRGLRKSADGRRKPLTAAHRAKISRSLRRAADGRRRPLTSTHKSRISSGLRRATDGRRHALSPSHRSKIARGVKRAWGRGAYGGGRSLARRSPRSVRRYRSQPIGEGLAAIIPPMEVFTDAAKSAGGALAVTLAEPMAVKGIDAVVKLVTKTSKPIPEIVMIPVDIVLSGLVGIVANVITGDAALAGKLVEGGLVATILNASRMVKGLLAGGAMGVIVPETTEVGQNEWDMDVEGLGAYVPETVAIGNDYIQEYQTPSLSGIDRFRPYFSG